MFHVVSPMGALLLAKCFDERNSQLAFSLFGVALGCLELICVTFYRPEGYIRMDRRGEGPLAMWVI